MSNTNVIQCFPYEDVATEKSQQNLIHGIEGFDASNLKHTETQEKNPLPDLDGSYLTQSCIE